MVFLWKKPKNGQYFTPFSKGGLGQACPVEITYDSK
jgi:hypothetical protein